MADAIFTYKITAGGFACEERLTITSGANDILDESIPGSSTNLELALAVDVSQLKACALLATGGTLNLFFNEASTGSPSKTLVLLDGIPFEWHNLSLQTNPWGSTDITALFVTKAGAGAVSLTGFFLKDPTV
jgi:hypothetical protein